MATKLNLGCGDNLISGFVNIDLYDEAADVRADVCELPYGDETVDEIVCYQTIEHVPYNRSLEMFGDWARVLKPGGTAIVETPDIDVVCCKVLEEGLLDKWIYNLVGQYFRPHDKDRYNDWEMQAGSIHRNPWNFERLERIAKEAGFSEVTRRPKPDFYSEYEENMSCLLRK